MLIGRGFTGPISANAEEPRAARSARLSAWAYLRERGGTQAPSAWLRSVWGLSPRTRRNPSCAGETGTRPGPISANAEEPPRCSCPRAPSRAYLRERGGTTAVSRLPVWTTGLSPRTRRNLMSILMGYLILGPISANAEEPLVSGSTHGSSRAYLRERGGTVAVQVKGWCGWGLSPRTRRNPGLPFPQHRRRGPISANAEEPDR